MTAGLAARVACRLTFSEPTMAYVFVALTIVLTVYGQLVIKWQASRHVVSHGQTAAAGSFVQSMLMNPWVLSGFAAAFLASMTWMLAVRRLQLSHAYPFMSLNFVLVLLVSAPLFGEALTRGKLVGLSLIVLGVIIGSRG